MKRADVHFVVSVCESWRVVGCAVKQDQEARGMMGFHNFERCPDCVRTFEGWEFWGENGHRQGGADTRASMAWKLRD